MPTKTDLLTGVGQVRLTLELTPQPTPTGGDVLVSVVLNTAERGPVPVVGRTIKFFHDIGTQHDEEDDDTTDQGRAQANFTGLGFGTHMFSAQIGTVYSTQRYTFSRPSDPPRVPQDLKVYAHPRGRAKKYYVSVELPSEQGGIPNWPIEIKDPNHEDTTKRVSTPKTGPDGAHRFTVTTGGPRTIFISVVGTPLDYMLELPGPPRKFSPSRFWTNRRWYVNTAITFVLFLASVAFFPSMRTTPSPGPFETALHEMQVATAPLSGEAVPPLQQASESWHYVAAIVFTCFGLSFIWLVIGIAPTFRDEFQRAVESMRVKLWSKYGDEIHDKGFFARLLVGRQRPDGAPAPAAAAVPVATTPPAGGGRPLTKGEFIFWEAVTDLATELVAELWKRR